MLVTKIEPPELSKRQLRYFEQVHDPAMRIMEIGETTHYTYEWINGHEPRDVGRVLRYLQTHVWIKNPLSDDDGDYAHYIMNLCDTLGIVLGNNIKAEIRDMCIGAGTRFLVHGDATMENFLQVEDQIVSIDPGMPRGFCRPVNDVGKLLQCVLTNWNLIAYGQAVEYENVEQLQVTREDLLSLFTHWTRILKNAERHHERVCLYGRRVVVPVLLEELDSTTNAVRYRWGVDRLAALRRRLVP